MVETPVEKEVSTGKCNYCGQTFPKSGMTNHLKACKKRKAALEALEKSPGGEKTRLFHLQVEGRYGPMYWMHLEAPAEATLAELDQFLRDIWLECCGHLSDFIIEKKRYQNDEPDFDTDFHVPAIFLMGDDNLEERLKEEEAELVEAEKEEGGEQGPTGAAWEAAQKEEARKFYAQFKDRFTEDYIEELIEREIERDMGYKLGELLKPGMKFDHEYDFGSTTELRLKVVGEREGYRPAASENRPGLIEILSRNDAPKIMCDECGKKRAVQVCTYCLYQEKAWFCASCAKKHEHQEAFLPVTNSPRVGVCGYCG
jgi:hypothetical protein